MYEPDKSEVSTFTVELRNAGTPGETWAVRDESGQIVGFAATRAIAVRAAMSASTLPNRTKWLKSVEAVDLAESAWTDALRSFRTMVTNSDVLRKLDEADFRVKADYRAQRAQIGTMFTW